MPELQINLVEFAPQGRSRLIVHVHGMWRGRMPPRRRPVLAVDLDGRVRRFSPLQAPRRRGFERFADWSVSFAVPAVLGPSLDGNMSLSFGDEVEPIPLPSLFDAEPEPEATDPRPGRGESNGSRRHRPQVERRPVSEAGRARRAARVRQEARATNATARLKRELAAMRSELREVKADRDKYYRTASGMARHVANMQTRVSDLAKAEQDVAQERDRLAADLASLRAELHGDSEPARRAGAAGRA